jgi:hypothetical protein
VEKGEGAGKGEEWEEGLRILDLCSGTGCIGLSLHARGMELMRGRKLGNEAPRLFGFDVEGRAVRLARRNLVHNAHQLHISPFPRPGYGFVEEEEEEEKEVERVTFRKADIFTDNWMDYLPPPHHGSEHQRRIDILVSNPPYISQRGFEVDTGRSVRNFEPKLALVPHPPSSPPTSPSSFPLLFPSTPSATPVASKSLNASATCAPEDIFYARLLEIAGMLCPRIVVFEVGDMAQARRVVEMAITRSRGKGDVSRWEVIEIWRDWPDCLPTEGEEDVFTMCEREVAVRGTGHGRVVFLAKRRM